MTGPAGLVTHVDKACRGPGDHAITTHKGRASRPSHKAVNRARMKARGPRERANAQPGTTRIPRKLRCCP